MDQFHEKDGLVTLHELADAFAIWEEKKDDTKLMAMIKPVEFALSELKSVVIRDSAVDAMCHGAQLAIPGVLKISSSYIFSENLKTTLILDNLFDIHYREFASGISAPGRNLNIVLSYSF